MMEDLISRKALLKHIEKIRQGVQMMDDTRRASIIMNGMYLCEKAARNQPSAQPTQEIIHCKDCRFWKKHKYFNGKPTYAPFCGFNSIFTDDNDFCSRAEKRGEAE